MKNPVPEVAFPYVCDYVGVLLHRWLHPDNPVRHKPISSQIGVTIATAIAISTRLHEAGYINYRPYPGQAYSEVSWGQLTVKGYLLALEIERQKRIDAGEPVEYDIMSEEVHDGFRSGEVEGGDQQGRPAEGAG